MTRIPEPPTSTFNSGGDAGEDINYVLFWRIVRKYWSTALATMLAVVLLTAFYTFGQTKIYEASATVLFDPNPPQLLGKGVDTVVDMGSGDYWNNREYYETQYKVIQSMRVALAVVKDLNLERDAGFIANAPPDAKLPPNEVSAEAAALALRGRLKVEPVKESRLAVVKLEDADPDRAQRILDRLVDTYISQNLDGALASTASASDRLRGQLDKLKTDLESSELALHDFKKDKSILSVAIDDQSNMLREEMKQINEALTSVRTRREELSARVAELGQVKADSPTNLPASELLQSPLLMSLREKYSEAERDRDALIGSGKGKNHPLVEAQQGRIDAAKTALLAEVRNIQGAVRRDLSVMNRQEAGLAKLFQDAKSRALELNLMEIDYNRLERTKDNTEKLYSLVLTRTKESDLSRMLSVNNLRIVDRPLSPVSPIRPRVPLNLAIGLLFGGALGVVAALGRQALDRTLKTPEDVEQELQCASLGVIPLADAAAQAKAGRRRRGRLVASAAPELVVHDQPTSSIAEAARAIRTNLIFMAPDKPFHTLLVTSASPSEGKTTLACHVAIAMAQAGQRVLLIDCDLRRPRIHRVFGKTAEVGVTTSILGDGPSDAVLETDVPNLSVVAAGPVPPNPAEILHSERFKAFLRRMSGRFDRVIIDSPPIVAVTDAVVLSTEVDGTLLVVRAFSTRKDIARHAIRAIRDVGGKLAGTVLNAVDFNRHEYKNYYYYYRRDYYARNDDAGSPPSGKLSAEPSASPPH